MRNTILSVFTFAALSLLVLTSCERSNDVSVSMEQKNRIEKAKKLLSEAGYDDPEDFPDTTLLYNTSKQHEQIAVAVQEMWKKHLGIDIELRNTEWKTYLDKVDQLDYQIARRGWIADYNDPFTFLQMYRKNGGNNDTGWSKKEYDRLLEKTRATKDEEKRRTFMEKAERILMTEVPVIPIYFYVTKELVKSEVNGWYQNERAVHPLRSAYRTDNKPLLIYLSDEIKSFDPGTVSGVSEYRVQNGLYEGLLRLDPKTLEPKPGVAKSWDVSEDGKTYTFHLRDCQWSDGEPVTAQDFVYSWKRVLKPELGATYADILYYIRGAEAYHKEKVDDPARVQVHAKDQKTLVVKLKNPTAFFLKLMAFFTYYPVRRDLIEKHGKNWTDPEHHVGNGAYTLAEHEMNSHILLKKNENYWDAGNVKQDEIKFKVVKDINTAFNLYEKNQLHILTSIPPNNVKEIKKRKDFYSTNFLGVYYYAFNTTKKPFDDPRVRRALGLAINRDIIVNKVTKAGEKPAYHYVPPVFNGFDHTRFDRVKTTD